MIDVALQESKNYDYRQYRCTFTRTRLTIVYTIDAESHEQAEHAFKAFIRDHLFETWNARFAITEVE